MLYDLFSRSHIVRLGFVIAVNDDDEFRRIEEVYMKSFVVQFCSCRHSG